MTEKVQEEPSVEKEKVMSKEAIIDTAVEISRLTQLGRIIAWSNGGSHGLENTVHGGLLVRGKHEVLIDDGSYNLNNLEVQVYAPSKHSAAYEVGVWLARDKENESKIIKDESFVREEARHGKPGVKGRFGDQEQAASAILLLALKELKAAVIPAAAEMIGYLEEQIEMTE